MAPLGQNRHVVIDHVLTLLYFYLYPVSASKAPTTYSLVYLDLISSFLLILLISPQNEPLLRVIAHNGPS